MVSGIAARAAGIRRVVALPTNFCPNLLSKGAGGKDGSLTKTARANRAAEPTRGPSHTS